MARMLAHSSIVPENYRGEEHIGNCVIALEIANRIGASILAVMQNLQLVEGKPGWSSQFLISCVNASRRFSPIRYRMTGTRGQDSSGCIAWAIDKTCTVLKSPEVTMGMAKAEGWYHRPGSKWKTMPELMLRYRSAALFTRLYAPELSMGLQTTDELADLGARGTQEPSQPVFEPGPETPKIGRNSTTKALGAVPRNPRTPVTVAVQNSPEAPAAQAVAVQVAGAPSPAAATLNDPAGQYNYLKALTGLIGLSRHSEGNLLTFLRNSRRCGESLSSLAEVADRQPGAIVWAHDNWKSVDRELTRLKQEKPA